MPSGAVTVGGLVINLAAETSQLKTDMADGARAVESGAKAMINSMVGVTESSDRATDAGARMVRQLKEEIATFGMSGEELMKYKANLNGVGSEVEVLMSRLNQMKTAQAGFSDQLAASETAATQRIRDMVAASMSEVAAMNEVAAATQGVAAAQAGAARVSATWADAQKLQAQNMAGVAASMKAMQDGTVAMSSDAQRILAQYDPLGAKLRSLQSDMALLRKEMGNSVDPAAIKAFQGLEGEIAKTQALMARAAAQANALGGSSSQLTLTQTQLIERFRDQAATLGLSRSQMMAYQAAQAGVTEQTKDAIAKVKEHEDAIKRAADAKERERNSTNLLAASIKLLASGYAALKVGELIKDSVMLAARYETLDVVMGVVGRTAGYTKTQMDAAAEGVAKQGITMKESRDSVIKLVQAHIDLSNASALARIAQDAAVIGNINSSEAFERLVNGVARGNVLILRNIGINVNLQAAYDQMAVSLGKSTRELTENERVQARLNAVLERGTDIAGTYEAAMDTASKQITSMKRYTEDLKTTFGEVFSESLTIAVMALTDGLKDANGEISELAKNDQLEEWGHSLTKVFVSIANEVGNAYTTFQKLAAFSSHLDARKAINVAADAQSKALSDYGNGMAEPGAVAKLNRIEAARAAALAEENADYLRRQAELSGSFDRFERAANEREAARLAKKKAAAEERLKVDQDYAERATALLIANANKSVEVQQAAQAKLVKEVYQGTPNFRDTEGRVVKPKVDQADNTRLQDRLARIQDEAKADKEQVEQQMKLDDMRYKAGEILDAEYYAKRRENLSLLAQADANMYAQQLTELRAHHNSTQAETAKNQKAIHDIIAKQTAANNKVFFDQQLDEEAERLREKKLYDDTVKATVGAGAATLKSLDDQIAKQKEHNAEIGKTKEQVELAKQALVDQATKQMESDAAFLRDGLAKWDLDEKSAAVYKIRLANLDEEIAKRKELSGLFAVGADAEAGAKAAAELDKYLNPDRAREFGNALKGSLGIAARSMIELTNAMQKYGKEQETNEKARAAAQALLKGNDEQRARGLEALSEIDQRSTKQQLNSYGNMASAAASFFNEHSRGYQALSTISQAFHAAELAMTMAELVPKAISAVLTQGQGDPYTAFGRMAAMGALVAGLGVAIGGADTTAKDRQAAQGAGSVLGDKDAKSESLKKSLDLIEKNTYQDLAISTGMLATLRSIDSNISSFASQVVRAGISNPDVALKSGVSGANMGSVALAASGFAAGSMITLIGDIMGPVGALAGLALSKIPAVQKLMTSIFGGKQSVSDSGFGMDPASLANILNGGAHAYQYADITTSGGWFRSDKHSVQTSQLDAAANSQFTAIITSLSKSIMAAGDMLGVAGDDFTDKLNGFVVDIGKVSLKDLKGDELQKALESVFSKLGDDMAQYAVGGLQELQQVGEGYLETLVRVASEYQTIEVVFQSFGKVFGQVGLESIAARDRLVQLAGGLDKFTSQGEYFLTNFFSEKEQAAALRARIDPTLAQYGLSSSGENAEKMFRDFIVGLDTTTEAGAKAYTVLMAIAPALKQVIGAESGVLDERKSLQDKLDELTMTSAELHEKERATVDASNLALYDRVAALQAEKDAAQSLLAGVDSAFSVLQKVVNREKTAVQTTVDAHSTAVSRLQGLSDALRSAYAGSLNTDQKLVERARAQAEIKADLAITRAGGVLSDDQVESLKKALSSATQDASTRFSSYQDYLRDLYGTQSDIKQLGDLTDASLSVEQQALNAAKDQLKRLDAIVANGQEEIDTLKGQSVANLTLAQVIAAFQSSLGAAQANPTISSTSAIAGLYQDLLGRAPDEAGLAYWQAAFSRGNSLDAIRSGFMESDEYKAKHSIPGFAGGGDHAGGWRIVGENGPELEATGPARIFNASQTSDLLGRLTRPSSNADVLAAAVDRLTSTVDRQQAVIERQGEALKQQARDAKRTADTLERLTRGKGVLFVQTDPATES